MTWRTLRTVAHYIMVHARFPEVYVHFILMYTTDHIFPFIPIKYIINEYECQTCGVRLTLVAPEYQEMNRQVEVTWRTLRTVAHSLMVQARVT